MAGTTTSFFALQVIKAGSPDVVLIATEQPIPAFTIGQAIDVAGNTGTMSGTVAGINTQIKVSHHGGDEVRTFTTMLTLT